MSNHIHLSAISVLTIACVVVLTEFFLHYAALKLGTSANPNVVAWGAAFNVYA